MNDRPTAARDWRHHAGLLPKDADARVRAITWMFAALNTLEPPILELATAMFPIGNILAA